MIHQASRVVSSPVGSLALLAVVSFVAGLLLVMVTNAVESAGIEGPGWSLRGNGALVVPACGFPIILIAGWALLARWFHADRRSCLTGPAAGIVALLVAWLLWSSVSWTLLPLTLIVGFIIALLWARGAGQRRTAGWLMAGTIILPLALVAGVMFGASATLPK